MSDQADQASAQINAYGALTSALAEQSKGLRNFAPPLNNALNSAQHLGVYFLGDARERPPSSGEPWTEDEYARLVMLVVRFPVNHDHRWLEISHALAINPDPSSLDKRSVKEQEQARLVEKNKDKKKPEDVILEDCYYCHGCGDKNSLNTASCESCATPHVTRSPEECLMQLPVLYYKYKDKVLQMDDTVVMKQRLGTALEGYPLAMGKELSQKERAEKQLYDESLNYGEFDLQSFDKLLQRCRRIFGHLPPTQTGVFWDLGCGLGKLALCAAAFHPFTQCWGMEVLRNLVEAGDSMIKGWKSSEAYQKEREYHKDITVRIVNADFLTSDAWVDNTTFLLVHATCFSDSEMDAIQEKARGIGVGCLCVTVTKKLREDGMWFKLGEDTLEMAWGKAKVYMWEKISVA